MDELLIAICKLLQNPAGNSMLSGSKLDILGCLQKHLGKSAQVELLAKDHSGSFFQNTIRAAYRYCYYIKTLN